MNYQIVKLLTGSVVVPEDYIVVNQTKTEKSDYAGVVAEKNGTLPHYLVFANKPISDYTASEEDELYDELAQIFPEVENVRLQEVEAIYQDGKLTNADEWRAAPRLGLFSIIDVRDTENLNQGTGIIREEN